jgi:hypothetical protein
MSRLTKAERETIIRWDEEDRTVIVYTASPPVMRKLERAGQVAWRESRRQDGTLYGKEYKVDPALFRWRVRTPAQLTAARKRGGFGSRTPGKLAVGAPQEVQDDLQVTPPAPAAETARKAT